MQPVSQALGKTATGGKTLVYGVGMLPIGDNDAPSTNSHGIVNDERGIAQFGGIGRFGSEYIALGDEDAVAAVGTAP